MFQGNNIPFACHNEVITIGRMKGNIKPGDKIFKIASHTLSEAAKYTYLGNELKNLLYVLVLCLEIAMKTIKI